MLVTALAITALVGPSLVSATPYPRFGRGRNGGLFGGLFGGQQQRAGAGNNAVGAAYCTSISQIWNFHLGVTFVDSHD